MTAIDTVINTSKVAGRRRLQFHSLDEILAEAERLAALPELKTLGNWSAGQIFNHLAAAMHMSIDGSRHYPPIHLRLLGPLLKRRVLKNGMPPGIRLPQPIASVLIAEAAIETPIGLSQLREAVRRMKREAHREPHNFFGRLTHQQWDQLHCRHAELHLSFLSPPDDNA